MCSEALSHPPSGRSPAPSAPSAPRTGVLGETVNHGLNFHMRDKTILIFLFGSGVINAISMYLYM